MFGSVTSTISLKKCFYLSIMVFILSTLMAMTIIIKLSPLESIVKCSPSSRIITDPDIEWSDTVTPALKLGASNGTQRLVINNKSWQKLKNLSNINNVNDDEQGINHIESKLSRAAWNVKKKMLPLLLQNNTDDDRQMNINYNIHIFYYAWYRSLSYDGFWKHWNHNYLPNWKKNDKRIFPKGSHQPPADIGANYYPSLGCYSSNDPKVIDQHMRQLRDAGVGVIVSSWSPPNTAENTDSIMSDLLDTAHRYNMKVAPHIEPYPNRNPINLLEQIRYLFERYSSHPALHRARKINNGPLLPVIYIYDSYVIPSSAWWEILSNRGNLTVRGTEIDAIYIGLLVDAQHRNHIKKSNFDGFYTYFAINGFSYGSTWKNWRDLNRFARQNGLWFIPSLGPGYVDTQVRAWNAENTRHRRHGQYYNVAWKYAMNSEATIVSITSFNEWHEGTQIEPAKPVSNRDFTYLDYEPEGPDFYLNLTKWWVQNFTNKFSNIE